MQKIQSLYTMNRPSMFNPYQRYSQKHFQHTPRFLPQLPLQYGIKRQLQPQFHREEFWCETCDRSFRTMQILENHNQQHQKCNIDGCQFVAHPKVIIKHVQMQHSSGLYKKIAKLDNLEEIKKWREERKKKYPTKDNVDKKAAEIEEKIKRGEKMGLKRSKNNNNQNLDKSTKKLHKFNNHNNHHQHYKQKFLSGNNNNKYSQKKIQKLSLPENKNEYIKPFTGIQELFIHSETEENNEEINCDSLIEDDDLQESLCPLEDTVKADEPTVCGALASLIDHYGSSDEEGEKTNNKICNDINTNIKTQHVTIKTESILIAIDTNTNNSNCHDSNDESGPEEVKIIKEANNEVTDDNKKQTYRYHHDHRNKVEKRREMKGKFQNKTNVIPRNKLPSSLLEKLLQREIQQERNIILQCIKYIVKNNYFDQSI